MYVWGREKVVSDPYSEDQRCLALILALDATPRGPPGLADCGGEAGSDSGPRDETLSSSDPSPGKRAPRQACIHKDIK